MVLYLSSQREPLKSKKVNIAGWSSLVARRAHNPKVVGSNPAPATTKQVEFFEFNLLFCVHIKVGSAALAAGSAAEVSMCLSCIYHTAFALEELEDLQGKNGHFCNFARLRLHRIRRISCLLPGKKRKTFPFYNKNVLAKTVFFCYTLANEYSCNRRMLWKRMY